MLICGVFGGGGGGGGGRRGGGGGFFFFFFFFEERRCKLPGFGGKEGRGEGQIEERGGKGKREGGTRTASAPCLFFHGMHRGKRVARRIATASELSTARWSGVSRFSLRLMPTFS